MKRLLIAVLLCSANAFGQGSRYDNRVATVASNVPLGANANVMAIPNAIVTICNVGDCSGPPLIVYSNEALTVPTQNPMRSNGQGLFGFWVGAGNYFVKQQTASGNLIGIYPITVGGTGSGGATLPTNALVYGTGPTSAAAATAAQVAATVQSATGCNTAGYVWSPKNNTCIPGGGSPSSIPVAKGYYPTTGSSITPNPVNTMTTGGDEVTKSTNGTQVAGIGANAALAATYNNATGNNSPTAVGALVQPIGYAGGDFLTPPIKYAASARLIIGNGVSGSLGTVVQALPASTGSGYNCASLPAVTISLATSGTPAVITPNCTGGTHGVINSWTITNPGTAYVSGNDDVDAILGDPPANASFDFTNQSLGPRAVTGRLEASKFGCVPDANPGISGGTDNYACIAAMFAEADKIASATGGYVVMHFGGGGSYGVYTYPIDYIGPFEDGYLPPGQTCSLADGTHISCVNLAPLTPVHIACGFKIPNSVIITGDNGAWITGLNQTQIGGSKKTTMFCDSMNTVKIKGMKFGGTNFTFVAPHAFYVDLDIETSFNDVSGLFGVIDGGASINWVDRTSPGHLMIGGWYQCRGYTSLPGGNCAEKGGYSDGTVINYYDFRSSIADPAQTPTHPHYPNGCTGTVPGGLLNDVDSIDDYVDQYFVRHCVNGTPPTNTSIPGLTVQIFNIVADGTFADGNAWTLDLDATNNAAYAYNSSSVTHKITIYSKKIDGTFRTRREIANAINQADFTGSTTVVGSIRVNITGDPSQTLTSGTSPVNFTGGVASTRLPIGAMESAEWRGVTGMGVAFYSLFGRPSGGFGVTIGGGKGLFRYGVYLAGLMGSASVNTISNEAGSLCNADNTPYGTPGICPDPLNFFTPNSFTPTLSADNSASCYMTSFSGTINNCEKYGPMQNSAIVSRPGTNSIVGMFRSTAFQANINQQGCGGTGPNAPTTESCKWETNYVDYFGYGATTTMQVLQPGAIGTAAAPGNMVLYPEGDRFNHTSSSPSWQGGGFVTWVPYFNDNFSDTNPNIGSYGYTADPANPYGYFQEPGKVANRIDWKHLTYNHTDTLASPLWNEIPDLPHSGGDGCIQRVSGVYSIVACGGGGGGLSSMTAGQVPIAATATTVTSSKPIAGSGTGLTSGPNSGVTPGDIALFTGTGGQITDGVIAGADLARLSTTQTFTGTKTLPSPVFTGTPVAPTAAPGTNTTQVATTAFVIANAGGGGNTTSTSLTTNCLPRANGANSIIDSHVCDDGTNVTSTEPLIVNASGNGIAAVEGTAPSGVAASDLIYPDSTAHRWKMNNNNGGAVTIASLSDLASSSAFGVAKVDGTTITAVAGVISATPGAALSGTGTPKGTTCASPGQTYYQLVTTGAPQTWVCSAHQMVWTNTVTNEVVYTTNTMYTIGCTQGLELNAGTGTSIADSCGASASTLVGSPVPVWNGTNGLNYNGTYQSMVQLSNTNMPAHSTYLFCMKSPSSAYAAVNPTPWLLAQVAGGPVIVAIDNWGATYTGGTTGFGNLQSSLQTVTDNIPTCLTVVYNGSGSDQFYIGSVKLSLKNPGNSLQTITAGGGLGPYFNGTIYKFYAFEGVELAQDYIQHNALIKSEQVATAISAAVPTTPTAYQTGNASIWYVGDSRVYGNGDPVRSPETSILANNQIPGLTVYNAGTSGQLMTSYVSAGIYSQAPTFLNQLTIPGSTPPPHVLIEAMGINDLGAGVPGATVYASFKTAMQQTYGSGWQTIIETIYASAGASGAQNTQRLAYNSLLTAGGQANMIVDIANDPRFSDRTGTLPYSQWGLFSPYYIDGLHPSVYGGQAIGGRHLNALNRLGYIGKGTVTTVAYAPILEVDLSQGDNFTVLLTGNVTAVKALNINQGQKFTINFVQDATGGRTVAYPTVGSGATATTTSGGVISLTGGGTLWDQNYQPTIYTTGLTCGTYPRYSSTIASGVITAITSLVAGAGCSGSGTVAFASSEPLWHGTMTVTSTANTTTSQSFVIDGVGQNIYAVNQTAQ